MFRELPNEYSHFSRISKKAMKAYILGFDQSTSNTKAMLFDESGELAARVDLPHKQIINELGWVEHNPEEILSNLFASAGQLLGQTGIDRSLIKAVTISNQRETALAWDRSTGKPLFNAIVWQCARAKELCEALDEHSSFIHERTGLHLSPYFSAAKFAWMIAHVPEVQEAHSKQQAAFSTVDSFLLYHLSEEKVIKTEFSNASRTQLLNLDALEWDREVASLFGIDVEALPELCDSNTLFGTTTLRGLLPSSVPVHGVMGDSQAALFAQGCFEKGATKATYGTGSSIMMNIGSSPILSNDLVTSVGWSIDGQAVYVLEGNVNYSGATISYLIDNLGILSSPKEAGKIASGAQHIDGLYMVPAFSGLGSPYWDADARAIIIGLDRRSTRSELVKAAEEAIAYQIADIVFLMEEMGSPLKTVHADGGATNDSFLMQFQADVLQTTIKIASIEELSAQGPAFLALMALGFLEINDLKNRPPKKMYIPFKSVSERDRLYNGWLDAVKKALTK